MGIEHHVETWIFYGACDLYFSFHSEEWVFDYHSAYSAIMALEKHFKACLIFSKENEFQGLDKKASREKAIDIAKSYSHNFPKMAMEVEQLFPDGELTKVIDHSYDGYPGRKLIEVLRDSYMETRYPTKRHVSLSFPVGEPNIYHNPLSSSGLHHFIQACCNTILHRLEPEIDMDKLLRNVKEQYQHLEPFHRFQKIYAPRKWC
ncbi:MAG: hypothetical protein AB2689_21610 [Candidatus Thiodiazotropha taylori]